MTMAKKHQSMTAYNLHDTNVLKPMLSVSKISRVSVEVLREDIKDCIARKLNEVSVKMAKKVSILGTDYAVGMLLP